MNLRHIHDEFGTEWSKLQACWEEARGKWRDEVADDFERRRWREWEERVPAFLGALQQLEEVISRALKDT
jgi:hypothetical protein